MGERKTSPVTNGGFMAETKLEEILRTRQFPGVAGVSDGPGSGNREIVFDRPNPATDIPNTLKRMEANGLLNTPDARRMAAIKMEVAKNSAPLKTDYQITGHPAERDD